MLYYFHCILLSHFIFEKQYKPTPSIYYVDGFMGVAQWNVVGFMGVAQWNGVALWV